MSRIFLDASFYVALLNQQDEYHEQAVALSRSLREAVVTTEYVLIELGNWLSQTGDKEAFRELLERMEDDERTLIVPCSSNLFLQAVEVYTTRTERNWTLSDCISFVVMQREEITRVATLNPAFAQAGFDMLLTM